MIIKPRSLLALSILTAFNVHSAGFQVAEHSASGLGRAFSGEAAVADNASVIARNPSAMTLFDRAQFSGAVTLVDPNVDVWDTTNGEQATDVAPMQVVPAAYYLSPINDKWSWGIGMFTTYGVATDYPDDIQAGDLAGDTSLVTVNLNPAVAYRINDQFSIGAGLNLVYAQAELTRHKGALAPFLGGSITDKLISLEGDTFGFGWNIGAMYEINQDHRLGFGYRSKVDLDFDDGEFKSYDSGITSSSMVTGRLEISLPAIWELSGFHQITEAFALHYSYQRTDWSTFSELKATSPDCNDGVVNQCFYKQEHYEDNGRWSIGGTYQFSTSLIGRVGFAYDEQAGKATLSIPDSDRNWYSLGLTYLFNPDLSLDAGFAYVQSKDGSFEETNALSETLKFNSKGNAYISSVQINYTF
ncbi:outer membrane protein transport protein [Vibrio aestuarianus]|uniref:Outer membrane protein transport protein n=1 Tax=Vibrio aestuarianus TaxID=28171 RepID=A0A9X4F9I6_9VIBR|nr:MULTISPECIES: outer membrane protein transport protein [Vibrio]MDE1222268.1 outer membrane protein transport protein [Vibrio aestuarianus]MDE1225247.1 outer membrane protein transport protein [Vibrio aestuarianus]MDE1236171.1 outer membrane protein transport protein [Vibrio aestuarianus]MDE1247040.1 outer membrane protein transport protein [Vibrio aestuarianus]MDE1254890.1 outer membrane protein transport protein [Vibrio aestuarianus]